MDTKTDLITETNHRFSKKLAIACDELPVKVKRLKTFFFKYHQIVAKIIAGNVIPCRDKPFLHMLNT